MLEGEGEVLKKLEEIQQELEVVCKDFVDFGDLELQFATGLAFAKIFFSLAPIMVFEQCFSIN